MTNTEMPMPVETPEPEAPVVEEVSEEAPVEVSAPEEASGED